MNILKLKTGRDSYNKITAGRESMTVEELIEELRKYPQDARVIFSNDNGYTYGFVNNYRISCETDIIDLTSLEEFDVERKIDNTLTDLVCNKELPEDFKFKDIITIFDELCEKASIENEEEKRYAKRYIAQSY